MDTLYSNSRCNLGEALRGMVGGNIEHTEQISLTGTFRGNRYVAKNVEDRLSPEQVEAGIHAFMGRKGFRLSSYQYEKYNALPGGCLKRYLHPSDPEKVYQMTISVPSERDRATVDIQIFEKSYLDAEVAAENAS